MRWDTLANLCMANLLCYYCFYLPNVLYIESTVSFLQPQFKDFALVSSIIGVSLGLLVRPFGAIFFGLDADTNNLRHSYYKCTMLLAVATLGLGFLPPHSLLGVYSAALNIVFRIIQGFAMGGAYSCAALLAYELAPEKYEGRYTSFIQLSAPAGYLSALAVVIVSRIFFGEELFGGWGWRATFMIAFILLLYSKKIIQLKRIQLRPSRKTKIQLLKEIKLMFQQNPSYLKVFLLFIVPTIGAIGMTVYVGSVYQLYFLQSIIKIEPTRAKFILAVSSFAFLPTFILFGYLGDLIGHRKVVLAGLILTTVFILPLYQLIYFFGNSLKDQFSALSGSTIGIILACSLLNTFSIISFSPLLAWAIKYFPNSYRTTLFAVCHSFAFGVLASAAQLLGTYMNDAQISPYAAVYFALSCNCIVFILWYFFAPREKLKMPSCPSLP